MAEFTNVYLNRLGHKHINFVWAGGYIGSWMQSARRTGSRDTYRRPSPAWSATPTAASSCSAAATP